MVSGTLTVSDPAIDGLVTLAVTTSRMLFTLSSLAFSFVACSVTFAIALFAKSRSHDRFGARLSVQSRRTTPAKSDTEQGTSAAPLPVKRLRPTEPNLRTLVHRTGSASSALAVYPSSHPSFRPRFGDTR